MRSIRNNLSILNIKSNQISPLKACEQLFKRINKDKALD